MKNIMINAYTRLNLGDDLFIKILCDRYPKSKFEIICNKKYSISFRCIKNLKCYSYDSFIIKVINYIFRKFGVDNFFRNYHENKSDVYITIGGSIFMQNSDWKEWLEQLSKKISNKKQAYILGANFGPYTDNEYVNCHRKLFELYTDICFRDKYSYNIFKELENVRMCPDIVFQIGKNEIKASNNTLVISVIKPSERKALTQYDDIYYKKIIEICIKAIDLGLDINLMSFCKDEGDEEAIIKILNMIPHKYYKNIETYFYRGNIDEALNIISGCKAIIATRFHAMILGYAYNKPVFPIIYSDKMKNAINDIDSNIKYSNINNINKYSVDEIIKYINNNKQDINIDSIIKQSENHFLKLDKYLIE